MKSSLGAVVLGAFLCSSCLELTATQPSGTSSSSSSSSGSGGAGGSNESGGSGATAGAGGAGGAGGGSNLCDFNDPTLLACFQFDGDFADHSGTQNPVMVTDVGLDAGVNGQAASFAGTGQVAITNTTAWVLNQITVELWYYQRSYAASTARMGLIDADGRAGLFIYGAGELRCTGDGQAVFTASPLPLNTWLHVACVHDGANVQLYVNGVLAVQNTAVLMTPSAPSLSIGANAPSGDNFDGRIDQVKIWNVARSAAQICKSFGGQGC